MEVDYLGARPSRPLQCSTGRDRWRDIGRRQVIVARSRRTRLGHDRPAVALAAAARRRDAIEEPRDGCIAAPGRETEQCDENDPAHRSGIPGLFEVS